MSLELICRGRRHSCDQRAESKNPDQRAVCALRTVRVKVVHDALGPSVVDFRCGAIKRIDVVRRDSRGTNRS